MELDLHCMKILGQLQAGDISFAEADTLMRIHGDQLLAKIFENGFTATYTAEDVKNWTGSTGVA